MGQNHTVTSDYYLLGYVEGSISVAGNQSERQKFFSFTSVSRIFSQLVLARMKLIVPSPQNPSALLEADRKERPESVYE